MAMCPSSVAPTDRLLTSSRLLSPLKSLPPGSVPIPTGTCQCLHTTRPSRAVPASSSSLESSIFCRPIFGASVRPELQRHPRSFRVLASRHSDEEDNTRAEVERERELELLRALNLSPEDLDEAEDTPAESKAPGDGEDDVTRALNLDPEIPASSTDFLAKVSSPEYQMRRRLEQTLSSTAFDVVEDNPWREPDKPVFVLANQKEQLFTMRTRRPRREVEDELDLLFFRKRQGGSAKGKGGPGSHPPSGLGRSSFAREAAQGGYGSHVRRAGSGSSVARSQGFRMHVEDIREGILVFEDEAEAAQYCRVLDDEAQGGSECMGVAQFQAQELFKVCEKSKALAVIFKKGSLPPSPDYLRHTLKARKESLED